MGLPATYDLEIYRGDDFDITFGLVEPGGRVIDDLVLTSGSAAATSATASFVAADVGTSIVTHNEAGITDACTISAVSSSTAITLSQTASASGEYAASIRALDCTAYTSPVAEIRTTADAGSTSATITWDSSRKDVGVFVGTIADTDTDGLSGSYVWDWQIIDGDSKVRTLLRGAVTVTADVSRPA